MRVFIAGASGDLGRALVRAFTAAGDQVVGLVRSSSGVDIVQKLGGRALQGDLYAIDDVTRHANGADVVIHAITAIPSGFDVRRASAWEANDRARVDGTRTLSEVAARVGASVYLQQSVAWVVKRAVGDPAYDEATTPNPPRLLASAVEGERIARAAGAQHGFAVGVLRGGAFYGADTAQSQSIAADLRARRLPILGDGQSLVAPIHVDDMAAAFVFAAHSRHDGLWHVVDDAPLPFATLLRLFASAIGAPEPRRVPTWLARMLMGSDPIEALTTSMHTSNARIRRELGWSPRYATFKEGVATLVRLATPHALAASRPATETVAPYSDNTPASTRANV